MIATPAGAAQTVCDDLVAAGVTSILNFAPAVLSVPEGVDVRKVDLSIELQILAYHEQRKSQAGRGRPLAAPMDERIKGQINDVPDAPSVRKHVAVEVETA